MVKSGQFLLNVITLQSRTVFFIKKVTIVKVILQKQVLKEKKRFLLLKEKGFDRIA